MTKEVANTRESLNLHHDLIKACKKGDQKAQFRICKLYYKAMYNISLSIVKDKMEAEDIMQESFLSAFEGICYYSGTVSFGAWLKSIVQNRSIDSLRKTRRVAYENIETINSVADFCHEEICLNEEPDSTVNRVTEIIKLLPALAIFAKSV